MIETDFLVIGSGISGLSFALKAARHGKVAIVTKRAAAESNTRYAQGGIACVSAPGDDAALHINDTLEAGAGLCNREAVEVMVNEAPFCISELLELGVTFSRNDDRYDLGREGGHSRHRILHYQDKTGYEIEHALLRAVKHHQNISLYENHFALDLILSDAAGKSHCAGVYVLTGSGEILPFIAAHTAICSGGAGQVYKYTTNPGIATGDGIAMAYRAGAEIVDMEFIQFHPTTLFTGQGENILLTEALRGAGAELVNRDNEPFLYRYHKLGSLAPRDIVARAMVAEMIATDHPCIYLDATGCDKESLKNHFTQAAETCCSAGYNLVGDRIPVVPAAHYTCGGIKTDLYGRTTIPSLYAFGEAACTGVHGGNRLASNSLLEALVFSHRAYLDMLERGIGGQQDVKIDQEFFYKKPAPEFGRIRELRGSVKELTWTYAGINRTRSGMRYGYALLEEIIREAAIIYNTFTRTPESAELYNMSLVAGLIFQQAMGRAESRGLHFIEEALAAV